MHTSRRCAHFWIATQAEAPLLQHCRASSALPNLTCCCCGTTFTQLFKPFVSWLTGLFTQFSQSSIHILYRTIQASQSLDTDVCLPWPAARSSSSRWRWSPWRGRMGRQHVLQLPCRHGGRVWRGHRIFILGSRNSSYLLHTARKSHYFYCLWLWSYAISLCQMSEGSFKDLRYWCSYSSLLLI